MKMLPPGFVSLGQLRQTRKDAAAIPPSRLRELIDAGRVDGCVIDGRYFAPQRVVLPADQPKPLWITWADQHYREIKKSALRRGIFFGLSKDDVLLLLARANGRCELTGIAFEDGKPVGTYRRPWMPSLDRKDSSKGYTVENCRVVCISVNSALNEFGLEVLLRIAKSLSERQLNASLDA